MAHSHEALDAADTWKLVEAASAGDESARHTFARRYEDAIRRWLWFRWHRTPLRGFVDDAVQDVFVECFRPRGALDRVDPNLAPHGFTAFLRGVVQHVACRIERSEARNFHRGRRLLEGSATTAPARLGSPEQLDRRWALSCIRTALLQLDRMSPCCGHSLREFLHLHFEKGLNVRTIAALWRQPSPRVHEMRRRACRCFRECLLRVAHDGEHDGPQMGPELLSLLQ